MQQFRTKTIVDTLHIMLLSISKHDEINIQVSLSALI